MICKKCKTETDRVSINWLCEKCTKNKMILFEAKGQIINKKDYPKLYSDLININTVLGAIK